VQVRQKIIAKVDDKFFGKLFCQEKVLQGKKEPWEISLFQVYIEHYFLENK